MNLCLLGYWLHVQQDTQCSDPLREVILPTGHTRRVLVQREVVIAKDMSHASGPLSASTEYSSTTLVFFSLERVRDIDPLLCKGCRSFSKDFIFSTMMGSSFKIPAREKKMFRNRLRLWV